MVEETKKLTIEVNDVNYPQIEKIVLNAKDQSQKERLVPLEAKKFKVTKNIFYQMNLKSRSRPWIVRSQKKIQIMPSPHNTFQLQQRIKKIVKEVENEKKGFRKIQSKIHVKRAELVNKNNILECWHMMLRNFFIQSYCGHIHSRLIFIKPSHP